MKRILLTAVVLAPIALVLAGCMGGEEAPAVDVDPKLKEELAGGNPHMPPEAKAASGGPPAGAEARGRQQPK